MKWVALALAVALGLLQYCLWVGDGSLSQVAALKRDIETQQLENAHLLARNEALAAEIAALRSGASVEDRARRDMGLIRADESFVLIVENNGQR